MAETRNTVSGLPAGMYGLLSNVAADPYKLIEDNYQATLDSIKAQQDAEEINKQNREKQYGTALTENNRGYNILYNNAINPFGRNAENRGVMGTGVSEYFMNAAYGNLLQGLGQSQQTYQTAMDTSKSDWDQYLLRMAGLKTDAGTARTNAILAQQQADAQAAAEAARLAEQQRQFDLSYALDQQQLAAKSRGGSGDGGINLGSTNKVPTPFSGATINGKYVPDAFQNGKLVNTGYVPRITSGKTETEKKRSEWYNPGTYVARSSIK